MQVLHELAEKFASHTGFAAHARDLVVSVLHQAQSVARPEVRAEYLGYAREGLDQLKAFIAEAEKVIGALDGEKEADQ